MTEPASDPADPPSPTGPVQLSGWRLGVARGLIALIVVWGIVLHIQAAPLFAEAWSDAEPAFDRLHLLSLQLSNRTEGIPVAPLQGGVAEAAGLPEGRLVAVDGRPLPGAASVLDAGRLVSGPIGEPVRLSVVTAAGDTATATVPRAEPLRANLIRGGVSLRAYRVFEVVMQSVSNVVSLVVALLLLVRRGRSLIALVGAGLFLLMASWSAVTGTAFAILGTDTLLGLEGVQTLFVISAALFVTLFPDGRFRPRWAAALPAVALAKNAVEPAFATMQAREQFSLAVIVPIMILSLVAQAIRYRRFASEDQRLQTKWALLGIAAGTISAAVGIVLLNVFQAAVGSPAYWWQQVAVAVLYTGFTLVPLGVLMSLLRYRLWDAEAAWSKSAMAAALTLALTAIVAGGTAFAQTALGAGGALSLALATAAAALVFVPIQRRLSEWADHRFLRDLTDLKESLPELVAHLRETESVEGIAEAVTDRVAPAVHARHVALVVPESDGWRAVGTEGVDPASVDGWAASAGLADPPAMTPRRRQPWRAVVWREPMDRQFPVRVALRAERGGGEIVTEGWLLLGPRPDGSGYGPDDLEAVATIAEPAGRALRVVQVREAREADRDARLDERLDRIETLLSQ